MQIETQDRVQVGPPKIQTAEDARMAYLREEVSEAELKKILARFGQSLEPTTLVGPHPNSFERVDDSFKRQLPDVEEPHRDRLQDKIKKVEGKEKEREAAEKATPKPKLETKAAVPAAVDPNTEPRKAAEKVAAQNARKQGAAKKSASTSK